MYSYYWKTRERNWKDLAKDRNHWKKTEKQWVDWVAKPKWGKKTKSRRGRSSNHENNKGATNHSEGRTPDPAVMEWLVISS